MNELTTLFGIRQAQTYFLSPFILWAFVKRQRLLSQGQTNRFFLREARNQFVEEKFVFNSFYCKLVFVYQVENGQVIVFMHFIHYDWYFFAEKGHANLENYVCWIKLVLNMNEYSIIMIDR